MTDSILHYNVVLHYVLGNELELFVCKEKLMYGNKVVLHAVTSISPESTYNKGSRFKVFYGDGASTTFEGHRTNKYAIEKVADLIAFATHCKQKEIFFTDDSLFCNGHRYHIADVLIFCAKEDLPVSLVGNSIKLLFDNYIRQEAQEQVFEVAL